MNSPEALEVKVDLRMGELYWAMLVMAAYLFRYLLGAIAVLTAVCLACLLYGTYQSPMSDTAQDIGLLLLPFVEGAGPAAIILIPLIMFIRTRQVFRSEALSPVRHYAFSGSGIDVKSQHINAQVQWIAVRQVRETRRFFFLYLAPQMANVLPKRCFPDGAALTAFRAMIRANVKETKLSA
jgi:hypothetical protein